MSRWRPAAVPSTALITRAGLACLRAELDALWRLRRPEVVAALAAAAAEGDRSENAEYHYRKKQLAEIDRRVRYLSKRLDTLRVVDGVAADPDAIFFGASIELEHCASGEVCTYRIVGPDEADARHGDISIDSPLARALLKRRVDDEVRVELPNGPAHFVVLAIRYPVDVP
ncbi:MAG: transcription elongation factor GreB [Lysobacterales bacterium CG17_big_fil_post_rev_8_21_14_2_50_64_11]|nr:MAG: transcription elongation factor GreB [Xanthomonadales bacterium CG17_big_fil_post_rev_8_21_14_2_50_64_11]